MRRDHRQPPERIGTHCSAVYAVSPTPVHSSSVAGALARIGSAPHHPSTAAAASTTVTTHDETRHVTVCTVPTASAEPAIPSAKSHRLAWPIQAGRLSLGSLMGARCRKMRSGRAWAAGGGYPGLSVAEEGRDVRRREGRTAASG